MLVGEGVATGPSAVVLLGGGMDIICDSLWRGEVGSCRREGVGCSVVDWLRSCW